MYRYLEELRNLKIKKILYLKDCNYSLTIADSKRVILDSTNSIPTQTINECAIKCAENKCSLAKFDPNKLIVSLN